MQQRLWRSTCVLRYLFAAHGCCEHFKGLSSPAFAVRHFLTFLFFRLSCICSSRCSQEIRGFAERAGYEFRLFSGETIRLEPDGTFYVDDRECSGDAFEGAALC